MRKSIGAVVSIIFVLSLVLISFANADWIMFHADTSHSGAGTGNAALTPTLRWKYTTGGSVGSSPAVVNNVVYIGSIDHNVYALNATSGALIWNYTTGSEVFSSPAVAGGVVYLGSYDGNVYALNAANGAKLWTYFTDDLFATGGFVDSSPAIVNGVLYIGSSDHNIYALVNGLGVAISTTSATLNVGQSQTFNSAVSNGISPYSYQWYLNLVLVLGANTSTWTFTPTSSGSYAVYLNVTDSTGEIAISNTANVNVEPFNSNEIINVQGYANGNSYSNTISLALTNQPQNGDVLIAAVGAGSDSAIGVRNITENGVNWSSIDSYDISWVQRPHYPNETYSCEIWLGIVGPGANSNLNLYLTNTAVYGASCDVGEYKNINTTSPLDQYGNAAIEDYGSWVPTGSTSNTTQGNELWIGAIWTDGGSQSNPMNGFALIDGTENIYNNSLSYLEKIVNATGVASSGTTISNPSSPTNYVGIIAAFKGLEVNGPIPTPTPQPLPTATPTPTPTVKPPISTQTYLNVIPNPVGVGQTVTISFGLYQSPPSGNGWTGITVKAIYPDGTIATLGPFTTNATGNTFTAFTPTQVGNFSFQALFPGEAFAGTYYAPSNSNMFALEVQQQPQQSPTPSPAPTTTPVPTPTPQPTPSPTPMPTPNLSFYCLSSTTTSGFNVQIQGSLTYNGAGLSGAGIQLSDSITGGATWQDLAYVNTDANGSFSAVWLPSASGNDIIKATWPGNGLYSGVSATYNFAVAPFDNPNQNVFSVTSNSTLTSLTFDSTTNKLSFGVSGPSGTTGFTEVCIPQSLIPDVSKVNLMLDGASINYNTVSEGGVWLITFAYHHSIHTVVISLGSSTVPEFSSLEILALFITLTALFAGTFILRKQR